MRSLPRVVLLCLIAAVTLVLFVGALSAAKPKSQYLRITVDSQTSVYVQFNGDELRIADTADGLETAAVTKAKPKGKDAPPGKFEFPEVALPLPADKLPAKINNITAEFIFFDNLGNFFEDARSAPGFFNCKFNYYAHEEKASGEVTLWKYIVGSSSPLGFSLDSAPKVNLPVISTLSLKISTSMKNDPKDRELGIGLIVSGGKYATIEDIQKDSKSIIVKLALYNSSNKLVKSETGPLSKFGFT